jgi:hypothetical protein
MSAVPLIASKFYAPQRKTPSAICGLMQCREPLGSPQDALLTRRGHQAWGRPGIARHRVCGHGTDTEPCPVGHYRKKSRKRRGFLRVHVLAPLTISQLAWPGMIVEIDVTAIVPLK